MQYKNPQLQKIEEKQQRIPQLKEYEETQHKIPQLMVRTDIRSGYCTWVCWGPNNQPPCTLVCMG